MDNFLSSFQWSKFSSQSENNFANCDLIGFALIFEVTAKKLGVFLPNCTLDQDGGNLLKSLSCYYACSQFSCIFHIFRKNLLNTFVQEQKFSIFFLASLKICLRFFCLQIQSHLKVFVEEKLRARNFVINAKKPTKLTKPKTINRVNEIIKFQVKMTQNFARSLFQLKKNTAIFHKSCCKLFKMSLVFLN